MGEQLLTNLIHSFQLRDSKHTAQGPTIILKAFLLPDILVHKEVGLRDEQQAEIGLEEPPPRPSEMLKLYSTRPRCQFTSQTTCPDQCKILIVPFLSALLGFVQN